MMVDTKSEDLDFSPPYLGNFSKGDAETQVLSFSIRPLSDPQISPETTIFGSYLFNNLMHVNSLFN